MEIPQSEILRDHVTNPSHNDEVYHTNSSLRNSSFFYGIASNTQHNHIAKFRSITNRQNGEAHQEYVLLFFNPNKPEPDRSPF